MITCCHPDWPGCKILAGENVTPENDIIKASGISHYRWFVDQALMAENRYTILERRIDSLNSFGIVVNAELCNCLELASDF